MVMMNSLALAARAGEQTMNMNQHELLSAVPAAAASAAGGPAERSLVAVFAAASGVEMRNGRMRPTPGPEMGPTVRIEDVLSCGVLHRPGAGNPDSDAISPFRNSANEPAPPTLVAAPMVKP